MSLRHCEQPEPCVCHGLGYAQGKDEAFFEIREVLASDNHATDCGCQPCGIIRTAQEAELSAVLKSCEHADGCDCPHCDMTVEIVKKLLQSGRMRLGLSPS